MRANRQPWRVRPTREQGVAAVEFALIAVVFFMFVFGVIEMARAMYVCNTLQEVTRRAATLAARADFSNTTTMQRVREVAVFRQSAGLLALGDPVTDKHIKIDYMSIQKNGASLTMTAMGVAAVPGSPAANHANCLRNPYGSDCVRLVRVRICEPDDSATCTPVRYKSLFSLVPLPFNLPKATTIMRTEAFGLPAGTPVAGAGG